MPTQLKLYSIRRQLWRFYCRLLIGSCCWQACSPLPQKSTGSTDRLVQPLKFEYLKLSTAISYSEAGQPPRKASIQFRLQKDRYIWFTITGPWGVEILRGMITPTGITLLNRAQKTYHVCDYMTLQALWPGPWDYALVQAVLLGEPARAYTSQEVVQKSAHEAVIQQQKGSWILNHLINPGLGKLEKLIAKGIQGTFTAVYHQFKSYQEGLLFKQATLSWYGDTDAGTPTIAVKLMGLRPRWSKKPLKFPFSIPSNYEKR